MDGVTFVPASLGPTPTPTVPNGTEDFDSTFTEKYQNQPDHDSSVQLQEHLYYQRRLLQQLEELGTEGRRQQDQQRQQQQEQQEQDSNHCQVQQFQHHQLLQDSFPLEGFTLECERVLQQYQQNNTMDIDLVSPIPRHSEQMQLDTLPVVSESISVEMNEYGGLDVDVNAEMNTGSGKGTATIISEMELDSAIGFLEMELGLEPGQLQRQTSLEPSELISIVQSSTGVEEEERETDIDHTLWPSISSSFSKPFGSLSDIQATVLTEEYVFQLEGMVEQDGNEPMLSAMQVSRTNSAVDLALPSLDALQGVEIEIEPTYTSSPYYSSTGFFFGSYRSPENSSAIHNHSDSSSSGYNTSSNSRSTGASSHLSDSLGLLHASNSPITFNTTTITSVMTDGEVTSDLGSDGLSFLLSSLTASSGPEGSISILDGGSNFNTPEMGIEPTKVLICSGAAGLNSMVIPVGRPLQVSMSSRSTHALMNGKSQLSFSMTVPSQIPTRNRIPILRGWTGETEKDTRVVRMDMDSRASGSNTLEEILLGTPAPGVIMKRSSTTSMDVDMDSSEMRNLKRKRSLETETEDEVDVKPFVTGSANVDKGDEGLCKGEHEDSEQKRQRKKRRVGSLTLDKGKARAVVIGDSDEESNFESDDDDDDVYYPSRSPSPAYEDVKGRAGSTSRMMYSGPRNERSRKRSVSRAISESAQTYTGSEGNSSSSNVGDDGRDSGGRKRSKGKAKGSAALALAKITMMSGKSPTSPWGTYVPFPLEDQDQDNCNTVIDHDIKAGRKRRNGHIPLPVPVPHLIKKSRGRKVPHVVNDVVPQVAEVQVGTSKNKEDWKRGYVCEVPGCGKGFVRGEHLKRHVRSIHTHDKPHPCPYEGCDKSFSRRDNLGQHVRIHLSLSS